MTGLRDGQSRSGEGWDWWSGLGEKKETKWSFEHWLRDEIDFRLEGKAEGGALTWSFLTQVDLFSKNLLLVPIHLEVHWCLVTADNVRKSICLYDSQGNALQKVARVTEASFFVCWSHISVTSSSNNSFHSVRCTEHPEILDDRSKGEEANSFWKRLVRVIRWGRYWWWCSQAWTHQEHKLICNATSPPAVLHRKSHNKPMRTTVECLSWRYRHASQAYRTRLESFWCLFAHSVHSFTVLEVPCAGKTSAVFTEGHTKDSQEDLQGALWLQAPWTALNSICEVALLLCDLHLHCGCMRLTPGGGGLLTKSQSLHDNYI